MELHYTLTFPSVIINYLKSYMFHPLLSKLTCCIFFLLPGLMYGLLMARLPAVKAAAELSDSLIGLCLFCTGALGLVGLGGSPALIRKVGSRMVLCVTAVIAAAGLCLIGFSTALPIVLLGFGAMGIGISMLDMAMNTQGVLYEHYSKSQSMNLFHAFYSLGAVLASLIGSVCATVGLTAGLNFFWASVPFVLLSLLLNKYLLPERRVDEEKTAKTRHKIPLVVLVCAVMALLAYAAEGSVGEWGALYLTTVKEASLGVGALVYGIFSGVTFVARLVGDPLRKEFGEIPVIIFGSVISFIGMVGVLSFSSVALVLVSYSVMGLGLAPIVPTLFSMAGKNGKIPAAAATSTVAFMAYGGLLVVPPSIGWMAQHTNLHEALFIVLGLIALMFSLALLLRKLHK